MTGENEPFQPDTDDEAAMADLAARVFGAARAGDAEMLASYVDAGLPVDLANEAGDTLLMLSAYHGHLASVQVLLKRGADANKANDRGQTPLAGAVFKNEPEIARALLDAGADPDAGSPSATDTARMFGKQDMLSRPTG
ncbi:MAG: ankyrin repeat domain-containing protein [Streptomycetaceae bacterium]|jgi:ankyrin repeat protein|nr:ankyrin repeat domain-containing protein [Streptomycetaceae bacterium]NUS55989.1 ankyrin repeat domain-containing protein [Streptomycetaceae bacterium]